ncbi:hypothetical protein BLX05_18990 [Bacillus pseudomycoides]|nr:hypothetical protein BLX05_18990 [Bacillus pseudomycoides]
MNKRYTYYLSKCTFYLSRYLRAVRPPSQDSERSKEEKWGITARKRPIGNGSVTLSCIISSLV